MMNRDAPDGGGNDIYDANRLEATRESLDVARFTSRRSSRRPAARSLSVKLEETIVPRRKSSTSTFGNVDEPEHEPHSSATRSRDDSRIVGSFHG